MQWHAPWFLGANLADQDHVRRLAQGVLQGFRVGRGVHTHFTLVDDAVLVLVHELHRVFDGDDVAGGVAVAEIDQRGGFARADAFLHDGSGHAFDVAFVEALGPHRHYLAEGLHAGRRAAG
jgi:hypothetical protein